MEKLKLYLLILILHLLTAKSLNILIITVLYYIFGITMAHAEHKIHMIPQVPLYFSFFVDL